MNGRGEVTSVTLVPLAKKLWQRGVDGRRGRMGPKGLSAPADTTSHLGIDTRQELLATGGVRTSVSDLGD